MQPTIQGRHRSVVLPVLLLAALLASMPLPAQELCRLNDTVEGCLERYRDWLIDQERPDLMQQPTGIDTGGENLATNTKDLLPRMALAGVLGQGSADQSLGTTVFDLNFSLPGLFGPPGPNDAQLQGVVNPQPQLSDAIRNALPEAQRVDLAGQLQGRIGGFGDHTIRFTYSPAIGSLGRDFAPHKAWLGKAAGLTDEPAGDFMKTLSVDVEMAAGIRFTDLPAETGSEALRRMEDKARELAAAARLMDFYRLVNNQPQLLVIAEKKFREPLVGPDELSAKVTYEWSRTNLTNLKAAMSAACPANDPGGECIHNHYSGWMKTNEPAIARGNRFSLSGEYVDIDGETVDTGLPEIEPIVIEPVRKLIVSLGWGRYFTLSTDGEPIKMDLVGKYEDVSDDPDRQDRGIVSLTFTRRMGKMFIPFGIVYANHGEFPSDVNARFSAHVGLRIGMSGEAPSSP